MDDKKSIHSASDYFKYLHPPNTTNDCWCKSDTSSHMPCLSKACDLSLCRLHGGRIHAVLQCNRITFLCNLPSLCQQHSEAGFHLGQTGAWGTFKSSSQSILPSSGCCCMSLSHNTYKKTTRLKRPVQTENSLCSMGIPAHGSCEMLAILTSISQC